MKLMQVITSVIVSFILLTSSTLSAQTVTMTTTMVNGEITTFNYGCPAYDGDGSFVGTVDNLDLSEDDMLEFLDLLEAFEDANEGKITSKQKKNEDGTVDEIDKLTAKGPNKKEGRDLCDFLKEKKKAADKKRREEARKKAKAKAKKK